MAVTRREYIYGCFVSSLACISFLIGSITSENWVVSLAQDDIQIADSNINYGLFRGEIVLRTLATPLTNPIQMVCILEVNACAPSCKTTPEAREDEVRALAQGLNPVPICTATTTINYTQPVREQPAVISAGAYISLVVLLALSLLVAVFAGFLAIFNISKNPTEPILGLPGILYSNIVAAFLILVCLLLWGIYWSTSGLRDHLAFAYIAVELMVAVNSHLGYSYWLMIGALICSIVNVVLVQLRQYLLEREPPPPTIHIDTHSDGAIFLY